MQFRRILISLSFCFFISPVLTAGDIKKVMGEATYHSLFSESPAEAEKKAIHEARVDALDKAFGNSISERTMSIVDTHEGHSSVNARTFNESEVNGEWIRDLKDPEITTEKDKFGTIYHVKVYGEAREIKFTKIDVDCYVLCNGTDPDKDRLRGAQFYEGDEMYVYFSSPVDGWLAIYLVDDDDEHTTQRLVPYDDQKDKAYPIQANKEYVFFSKPTAESQYVDLVTRMILECRKRIDINELIVIFSPNEFSQTATTAYKHSHHGTEESDISAMLMPSETTYAKFDNWLVKLRRKDAELQQIPFNFSICKK